MHEELIERLAERQLWTFHSLPAVTSVDAIIPFIDADGRIQRGDFIVVVRSAAVKEGRALKGDLETVICAGPGAFRSLRGLPIPPDGVRVSGEHFHSLSAHDARELWQYLLKNDRGLAEFAEKLIAPTGTLPAMREWHLHALALARRAAGTSPVAVPLLLDAFYTMAERRKTITTFDFLRKILTPKLDLSTMVVAPSADKPPQEIVDFAHAADAIRVTTGSTDRIHSRHFAAAFLLALHASEDHRRQFLDFVVKNVSGASRDVWAQVLELTDAAPFSIDTIISRDTWTIEDRLGYGVYARAITKSMLDGDAEPPLTIGIQAPWGQGKTSLMRMMQQELDDGAPQREERTAPLTNVRTAIHTTYARLLRWIDRKKPVPATSMIPMKPRQIPTVWFNPLYYRETSQVWAGMGHAILHQLAERLEPETRELFWFRLQQSRINTEAVRRDVHASLLMRLVPAGILMLVAIGAAVMEALAISIGATALVLTGVWKILTRTIDRPFERYVTEPNYQTDLGLLHLIDHDLDRALRLLVADQPIAVFIDDLDRCDPQTVSQVILAINQFLSLPRRNVYFILGMDMEMVAHALEQAQKNAFGGDAFPGGRGRSFGWRFMEKFVQLPFVIPHLDADRARKFAESHLRRGHATVSEETRKAKQQVADASTAAAVGEVMAKIADLPAAERVEVEKAASDRVADLMKSNDSEEMKRIAAIAVQDLELNPRTIVRYFCLVRVLRNVQLATGRGAGDDADRKLVLYAAHLLMNWPQFVQWLHGEGNNLEAIEELIASAADSGAWNAGLASLLRREQVPPYLADPALYAYLRKIGGEATGVRAMYDARLF